MARNIGPDSLCFSFLFFPPLSYQISFTAASAMLKYDYSCFHHQLDLFFDWFNPKSREFFFGFVFFRSVLLIFFFACSCQVSTKPLNLCRFTVCRPLSIHHFIGFDRISSSASAGFECNSLAVFVRLYIN